MNTMKQRNLKFGTLLLLVIAVLGFSALWAGSAQAATLPAETCTLVDTTRTCEFWATTGTLSLPDGNSVVIWGYTDTFGGAAQLPGPAIIANQGETVQVILHNDLGEATSLDFQGQGMIPDLAGVPAGGTTTYAFAASQPGTFLYQAGPLPNAQHQVAMGMFGALIVRPAVPPTFVDEALVVLSEVDPALNNSLDPAAFDMRDYKPTYWLINGEAYPDTEVITGTAGVTSTVLLRYINAGLQPHTMGLLGLDQTLLANDGIPLPYTRSVVAETIAPGETMDTLVSMPATAPAGGAKYALYDTSLLLHNNNQAFGGMLTFLAISDGTPPGIGPVTTVVSVAPNPTDGSVDVSLTATIPGATEAEYFIDAQGGTATPMNPAGTDIFTATVTVSGLSSGDHTFYVHGSDGIWGAFNFAVLHLDKLGPMTSGIVLSPNPSAGGVAVAVSATGDDSATGGSNVVAAEYVIDDTANPTTTLAVSPIAPIASLYGSIGVGTMGTLVEGEHTLYVRSQDSFGHWGDYATAALKVDKTGPETSNILIRWTPNNGTLPYSPSQFSVRVDATVSDTLASDPGFLFPAVNSQIKKVEGFIDTVGVPGTGFPLTPYDGLFNSPMESAYAYIPLANINALSEGLHQIWIRGQDKSGNWGVAISADLVIDKTAPVVSSVLADPNPTGGAITTTLTASAVDAGAVTSEISHAEFFDGADPGRGNGTPMTVAFNGTDYDLSATIDVTQWTAGDHTLSVRARDKAGNWSAVVTYLLSVQKPDAIFADSFESGNTGNWNGGTFGSVAVVQAAKMGNDGGTWGMAVTTAGNTPGYVVDLTPTAETSYHARFYFNPNSAITGNTQQDIFVGRNVDGAGGNDIFRVQYRRRNAQGGTYEVRGWVQTAAGVVTTDWLLINNGSANAIEIAWASGPAASFSLYVHGGLQRTLTGLNTSAYTLEAVRLGPSAGLVGAASGTQYYDAFVSRRYTNIGP